MRHLLESGAWLLVPGPGEEERGTDGVVASILFAGLVLLNGIYPGPTFGQAGEFADLIVALFLATGLVLSAVLHALPPGRRRARLGARIALTLIVLAFVVWFPVARLGLGVYGAVIAALLAVAFLYVNLFFNRHRALRSLEFPVD